MVRLVQLGAVVLAAQLTVHAVPEHGAGSVAVVVLVALNVGPGRRGEDVAALGVAWRVRRDEYGGRGAGERRAHGQPCQRRPHVESCVDSLW